jgi:hypothetical protein
MFNPEPAATADSTRLVTDCTRHSPESDSHPGSPTAVAAGSGLNEDARFATDSWRSPPPAYKIN